MKIKPFAVEEWMNAYEVGARFNIAETCVDSVSLDELFALTGEDKERLLDGPLAPAASPTATSSAATPCAEGICKLYRTMQPERDHPHPRRGGGQPPRVLLPGLSRVTT